MSNILNIDNLEHSETQSGWRSSYRLLSRKILATAIFEEDNIWATAPLLGSPLVVLIGRYSPHCRHKPLRLNILGNIFLDKLGRRQM